LTSTKIEYDLAVILVNKNNNSDVVRIFDELLKQNLRNWCFIVVDDYSDDISPLQVLNQDNVFIFRFPHVTPLGYAEKHNYAFRKAVGFGVKYIFKMHTDMELVSNYLINSLIEAADRDPKVMCVGPTIKNGQGVTTWGPGIVKTRCDHTFTVHESYLVRSSYLSEYDGYQDEIFTWFGEEMDFFARIYKLNLRTAQSDAFLIHYGGATSKHFRLEKCFYRAESTLVFLYKHNSTTDVYRKIRLYTGEIAGDLKYIRQLFREKDFKLGLRGLRLIIRGFTHGYKKIYNKNINIFSSDSPWTYNSNQVNMRCE